MTLYQMIRKRGQAALEFLMTYGWAFLVMIAVIAGIVALDPLGAAQTSINTCQIGGALSCGSDALVLSAAGSGGSLDVRFENAGRESITVDNITISNSAGDGNESMENSSFVMAPGETFDVEFGNPNSTIGGGLVSGDQYTFELSAEVYTTRVGDSYSRPLTGQIRATAS